MTTRLLGTVALLSGLATTPAVSQTNIRQTNPPPPISELIKELKAPAPYTRNGAAYQLAHMGPKAAPAVPALIEALQDPSAAVRYPAAIALREIGPAAKAAVPALKKVAEEDVNDEVAAEAKQALRRIDPSAVPKEEKGDAKD